MNELSCKVDAEAIAQTLWQKVIGTGWIESVQSSIDKLYQDMLHDNLRSGMHGLDDLYYDLLEYNDEHIREAIEFEFNNLDSYEEERRTIRDEEEYIETIDEWINCYYESEAYDWYSYEPYREMCMPEMHRYIMAQADAQKDMIEVNCCLQEEGVVENFNDELLINNANNTLFDEMIDYSSIFCPEICRELKRRGQHFLIRGNQKEMQKLLGGYKKWTSALL